MQSTRGARNSGTSHRGRRQFGAWCRAAIAWIYSKTDANLEMGRHIAFLLERLDHGLLTGQELSDAKKLKRLLSR
jgi:hypothetical protein